MQRGLPVIPVVLGGAVSEPRLPMFLREFRVVRFQLPGGMAAGVEQLIWGITGSKER
jgi:hypothetical protein